jgi:heterodisulfide reductase subunit A-like polyferredoxin
VDYDVLVTGSGIGGMESALKLGDMGYKVLVVEKEPSIGGKMIHLSKVFPTLDCASCIATPKMAATAHHPNVTVATLANVTRVTRQPDGSFRATVHHQPRFIDEAACTGCRLCEQACTVAVPDQFNARLVSRRAAYIPFPQAIPQKALIERAGTSPCIAGCPAGIKAHGYVSLIRSGEYDKAFSLVLETTPLAGSLGRACYAPCEARCTRGSLEGPVPIRRLKRFAADKEYEKKPIPNARWLHPTGKRVAIIGSGPAGLTAAWQLALVGHRVKIFEAAPAPGGALRLSIPSYRLPTAVVERDIANLTALGVEVEANARVTDLATLHADGFDAVLVATGTPRPARLGVPGEELAGVRDALSFLRDIKLGSAPDFTGKSVTVIGGGNVAIDAARSARRLGAAAVHLACLEANDQMPAYAWEVAEAQAEGVTVAGGWGVAGFYGGPAGHAPQDGQRDARQLGRVVLKKCLSVFDAAGRFSPRYAEDVTDECACDLAIVAIGMGADTAAFPALAPNGARTLQADPVTSRTALPGVFAAGDAVTGPTTIAEAVGHGRAAAAAIDRFLHGLPHGEPSETPSAEAFSDGSPLAESFTGQLFTEPLPTVAAEPVLARQRSHSVRPPLAPDRVLSAAPADFAEIEPPLTEAQALAAAGRCLDCGVCSECHECVAACPANAIDLDARERDEDVTVGAVVLATGYELFAADAKPQYGYGRYKNVITGMEMERLLAPTRPYNTVLRPGDGKVPERIAYVMCTGSRDLTVGNPLCSKFCCMYSIKQNQLVMGVLPLADVTVHYIDIRAAGKGYDEFFEQAKAMGATFVKGRVASISEKGSGDLIVRYEDIEGGGGLTEAEYDLVVLAVGVTPNAEAARFFGAGELALDSFSYIDETDPDASPGATSVPGVFVAGSASAPRDIPETILHAGAAVAQAAGYLERRAGPREPGQAREEVPT